MTLPLKVKLPLVLLAMSIIPAVVVGTVANLRLQSELEETAFDALNASTNVISDRIAKEFDHYHATAHLLAESESTSNAVSQFQWSLAAMGNLDDPLGYIRETYASNQGAPVAERAELLNADDGKPYSMIHERYHAGFKTAAEEMMLSNIALVNTEGNVLYSYAKGAEFGKSIDQISAANPDFAAVAESALAGAPVGSTHVLQRPGDDPIYFMSYSGDVEKPEAERAYMASTISDKLGTVSGAMVLELPALPFLAIMNSENGLDVARQVILYSDNADSVLKSGSALTNLTEAMAFAKVGDASGVYESDSGADIAASFGKVDLGGASLSLITMVQYDDIMAGARSLRNQILLGLFIMLLITAGAAVGLAGRLTKPMEWAAGRLSKMARELDLTKRISKRAYDDEMGAGARAIDQLLISVDDSLKGIRRETHDLGRVAETLETSAQSLASNSDVQSAAVEELSSSLEQTASQVRNNAKAAESADQLVASTASVTQAGRAQVTEMREAMTGIDKSSNDIAKIIAVIDEIAFQTNLLALNAAVEAARAGQHGRGFAVVAQEVRNLAARSAKAARETSSLIDKSLVRVAEGVAISERTVEAFDQIAENIESVSTLVSDISAASAEQSRGVDLVNESIVEIARITREVSQQSDNFASTATQITMTNERLREQISIFNLSEDLGSVTKTDVSTNYSSPKLTPTTSPAPANTGEPITLDRDERGFGSF